MKTTQKLVQLLVTLQPDEKRHILRVLDRNGDSTQARQLYDILLKHLRADEYGRATLNIDEEQLVNRLHREGVKPQQFHVVRNNLQSLVLKALRQLSEEHNKADEIRKLLNDAQILERRGLYGWAEELLKKALEISGKYHFAALAIETLYRLVGLNRQMDTRDYVEKILVAVGEMESILENYREEVQLYVKWNQAYMLEKMPRGLSANDFDVQIRELLSVRGIADPESVQSFMGKLEAYQARGILASLTEGYLAAHPWFEAIVKLWQQDEYQHLKEAHPRRFIIHISNYMAYCLATENYQTYLKYISLLEDFKASNVDDKAELFHHIYFLKQLYFLNTGKFEESREIIPAILKGLTKYAFKINKPRLLSLIFNIILTYFALADYKSVLASHKNSLAMWKGTDLRRDLQTAIRFLVLISQIEQDNFDELDRFLKQVKPNLDTEAPDPDFERIVLIHLVLLADAIVHPQPDPKIQAQQEKEHRLKFYERLKKYKEEKAPQSPTGLEEILFWLQSKIDGKPFTDLVPV